LANLGLGQQAQQIGAAGQLGQLGLGQLGQELGAAGDLGQLGLSGGQQQLQAALGLGDLGLGQTQQQLQASGMLPGLATADINLLSGIGGQQQELEQQRINNPMNAQLQMLQAALGGLPISNLLGGTQKGTQTGFSMGFGG